MNNREIKFRTWDRQNKEFAEWTNRDPFFDTSHGKIFFWERVQKEDGSYDGDIILQDYGDRFVLQQYTGLKDSKGVEIYEGDIVDCKYDDEKVIAEIKYSEESAAFLCGENALWQGWLGKAEVIGNIFENPELIKNHDNNNQ